MNTDRNQKRIIIIGAGIAGLAAARRLSEAFPGRVLVLEKEPYLGGLAATVTALGRRFDLGSHRIHHGFRREAMEVIRQLCGEDLLSHRRNGLIFIGNKRLRYPPNAYDIVKGMGIRAAMRFAGGLLCARAHRLIQTPAADFASYSISKVGRPLYESFYHPYAVKLWRIPPSEISYEPAMRRTRAGFWGEMRRLLSRKQEATYLYPAQGIGEIAEALAARVLSNGGEIQTGARLESLQVDSGRRITALAYTCQGSRHCVQADSIIATIPPADLLSLLSGQTGAPPSCDMIWRGLRIMFFLSRDVLSSDHETYYIPSPDYLIGRVSEIAKYSGFLNQDDGRRALTLEIPCSQGDTTWNMDEAALRAACAQELTSLKILGPILREPPISSSLRLSHVYPVHLKGWRLAYEKTGEFLDSFSNLYRLGRSALFMHSNLDHSLAMGLMLGDWMVSGGPEKEPWPEMLKHFSDYYVRE